MPLRAMNLRSTFDVGIESNNLQVEITEDQTSPDQLRDAFQGAASNKVRLEHFRSSQRLNCARAAVCDGTGFAPGTHTRWRG